MARIKYTALVESIRGSIQGTTFQRNAYGYTIKGKPNIVNPSTPSQNSRKTILQQVQSTWRALGDTERATWDTYATNYPVPSRLNPDAYLGGQQLFIRTNCLLRLFNFAADVTTGGPFSIFSNSFRLVKDGTDLYFECDQSPTPSNVFILAFAAPRLSAAQNIVKSKLRYMNFESVVAGPFNLDITAAYTAKYGGLPDIGDFVGAQFVYVGEENATVIRTTPVYYEVEVP